MTLSIHCGAAFKAISLSRPGYEEERAHLITGRHGSYLTKSIGVMLKIEGHSLRITNTPAE